MNASHTAHDYELRFRSLFNEGHGYAFPCDERGHVDMDSLGERLLNNYLYARALMGRDCATPTVRASVLH